MSEGTRRRPESAVPDKTLETLARNFCREAKDYGFGQVDYLRYVNYLLEYADESPEGAPSPSVQQVDREACRALPLSGKRVSVRAYDPGKDAEHFKRWLADAYGRYFLLSRTSGRRTDIDALTDNPSHHVGVITVDEDTPIGSVVYLNHDEARSKAELRKIIGEPKYRGTGLAKEATELWIAYGLTALGLKKIVVNTLHTHFRNIQLNESLGFKVEGLLHHEAFIDGKYHDVLRMGLWWEDFEK